MIIASDTIAHFSAVSEGKKASLPKAPFFDRNRQNIHAGQYEIVAAEKFTSISHTPSDEKSYIAYDVAPVNKDQDQGMRSDGTIILSGKWLKVANNVTENKKYETFGAALAEAARLNEESYNRYLDDCQNHDLEHVTGWKSDVITSVPANRSAPVNYGNVALN
jgi:hypothetical protein